MIYNIHDKIECKKETNGRCLELCNPDFDIKVGDEYIITDKDNFPN